MFNEELWRHFQDRSGKLLPPAYAFYTTFQFIVSCDVSVNDLHIGTTFSVPNFVQINHRTTEL